MTDNQQTESPVLSAMTEYVRRGQERAMTDPKLHELLDQAKFGDRLTLTHSNGKHPARKHTARVSGPVLTDQARDPSVGIDLLDGDPHIVRTPTGVVWAPVVQATLYRGGELIAKWDAAAERLEARQTEASLRRGLADITAGRTVDLGSFAQPATAPQPAQAHGDAVDPARPAERHIAPETYDVRPAWLGDEAIEAAGLALHCDACTNDGHDGCDTSDWDREAEVALDAALAVLRAQIAAEIDSEAQAMASATHHLLGGSSEKNTAYRMGICDGLTGAARITRGEKP